MSDEDVLIQNFACSNFENASVKGICVAVFFVF
jgi:hypothetical protein